MHKGRKPGASRGNRRNRQTERYREQLTVPCPDCQGRGKTTIRAVNKDGKTFTWRGPCARCHGAKVLTGMEAKRLVQQQEGRQ